MDAEAMQLRDRRTSRRHMHRAQDLPQMGAENSRLRLCSRETAVETSQQLTRNERQETDNWRHSA